MKYEKYDESKTIKKNINNGLCNFYVLCNFLCGKLSMYVGNNGILHSCTIAQNIMHKIKLQTK